MKQCMDRSNNTTHTYCLSALNSFSSEWGSSSVAGGLCLNLQVTRDLIFTTFFFFQACFFFLVPRLHRLHTSFLPFQVGTYTQAILFASRMSKQLIVFDFDWSFVDQDTDRWVFEVLSTELRRLLQSRKSAGTGMQCTPDVV